MSKLDDIFKFLDLQNSIVTLISGIEYMIYGAYGDDEVQASPEIIKKANACFASLESYFSQKEIVFLPDTVGNMISSYLLEECKDKTLFGQLLETKFSKYYFDVKHDYGCFYDYCRAADRLDIAEAAFVFMNGTRKLVEDLLMLFNEQSKVVATESESPTSLFEYDPAFCTKIYDFCITTRVFRGITHSDFCTCVASADFSPIYHSEGRLVAKLKYVVYILSRRMNNPQWYSNSAHSIDTEPNKCSGASVPLEWKRQALAIK